MGNPRVVSQRGWIRGLNAAQGNVSQLPATVVRCSNMLLTVRGSLKTCDGSAIVADYQGVVQPFYGPITALFLFLASGTTSQLFGIQKDPINGQLPSIAGFTATDSGIAGNVNGNTRYVITALDGAGGETVANTPVTVNVTNKKVNLAWTALTNATGYNIYRIGAIAPAGTEVLLTTIASGATTSYQDNTATIVSTQNPPVNDTTQQCQFFHFTPPSYDAPQIIHTFPADAIPIIDVGDLKVGGAGSASYTPLNTPSKISGGVVGNLSPIPQIIQLTDKMFLALGNGMVPYVSDGTSGGTIPIVNNFTSDYPPWIASTAYATGDIIGFSSSPAYVWTATQGGTSGGSTPAFSGKTAIGTQVHDNNIIWKLTNVATAIVPPGATHAIKHAGAVWIFNTSPTYTSDNLHGPDALLMSDINNANSWNPVNQAFIGKGDGSEGMGLASFTIAESGIPPTGSLLCFKAFSTYQVNAVFGASNFAIQQTQSDMGCIAPRTLQFIPGFGVARLTHLGIAIFDGVRDRIISEEIRPYLFGGASDINPIDWNYAYFSKATQAAVPPLYMVACPIHLPGFTLTFVGNFPIGTGVALAKGTYYFRVYGLDSTGTPIYISNEVTVTSDGVDATAFAPLAPPAGVVTYRVFMGRISGAYTSYLDCSTTVNTNLGNGGSFTSGAPDIGYGALTRVFCYDLVLKAWTILDLPFGVSSLCQARTPGTQPVTLTGGFRDTTIRSLQYGATDWDGTAIKWNFRTADVFASSPSSRTYFRRIIVRGVVTAGASANLSIQVALNGVNQPTLAMREYDFTSGQFEAVYDINATALNANATISGTGQVEIQSVDWHVQPKPVGPSAVAW